MSSSDNSSYESAPQALDSDAGTLTNDGQAADGDDDAAMAQEESSGHAPNLNADPVTDSLPNPSENPNPNPSPPKKRGRKKKEVPVESPPEYMFRFQAEEAAAVVEGEDHNQAETQVFNYKPNDLVWGKVKHHPWWPGQIYDPSLASAAALRIKKESHLLVAYFGDKTFAWVDTSCLKPYMATFPKMDKQSRSEGFVTAVNSSLAEVSRRIELALTCNCSDKGVNNNIELLVDNSGIVDGTCVPDVNNSVILESFEISKVMEYVQEIAVYGPENTNRLEAAIARAYLKGFDRFRGFSDAPEFDYHEEFGNDPDKVLEGDNRSGSGRRRKKKDESIKEESEAMPKKRARRKGKKKLGDADDSEYDPQSDSDDLPKMPKRGSGSSKKMLSSDDESEPSSESSDVPKKRGRPKKIKNPEIKISDGEYDSTSESDEVPRKRGRPKKKKSGTSPSPKLKSPRTSVRSDTSTPRKRGRPKKSESRSPSNPKAPTESDTGSLKKRGCRKNKALQTPSATEMLKELCLIAQKPVRSARFTAAMQSFFTRYSDSLTPESVEEEDANATKSGRKVVKPKHIQDSYWTDVMVDTGSDKDDDNNIASVSAQKKKRGIYNNKREKSNNNSNKKSEIDINVPTEENADESEPTGLVLLFNNPDMIPSVQQLNDIFRPHGALRETETEIDKRLRRATVIFKKRADAEAAFSSTGKYSKFGPALLSYELNYSPGPPKKVPDGGINVVDCGESSVRKGAADLNVSPGKEEAAQASTAVDIPVEPSP